MAAAATARGRQQRRQRSVFVKAEQQCRDDWQPATVKDVRAKCTVLRAENKQSNKNPKGGISLRATVHKNLLCFAAGRM